MTAAKTANAAIATAGKKPEYQKTSFYITIIIIITNHSTTANNNNTNNNDKKAMRIGPTTLTSIESHDRTDTQTDIIFI